MVWRRLVRGSTIVLMPIAIFAVTLKVHWELWGKPAAYLEYQLLKLDCYERHHDESKEELRDCLVRRYRDAKANHVVD